jgi:hypothetical protein
MQAITLFCFVKVPIMCSYKYCNVPADGKLPQDQHPLPIHLKECETSSPLSLQEHHHSEIISREIDLRGKHI